MSNTLRTMTTMKMKITNIVGAAAMLLCATTFTGCIDETEPTDIATKPQVDASSSAQKAMLYGLHAYLNKGSESLIINSSWHAAFGYSAMQIIRDLATQDMGFSSTSYMGHFSWVSRNKYMGKDYTYMQYVWNYYYGFVLQANEMIKSVDESTATDLQLGYLGAGYAFRALAYLDLARMYEFLPNDKTSSINDDGNNVLNLTVPIVTEDTTETGARNNPRVSREVMAEFIKSDLDKAEKYIVNLELDQDNILPSLACVYGLKARLYMWLEDYANAKEAATQAIDHSGFAPISESEGLSTTAGFNNAQDFMWAAQLTKEDYIVSTGICNPISWKSNQTTFGYVGPATGVYVLCDKNFYDRISDTDWRKKEFQAPSGTPLRDEISYISDYYGRKMPAYAALKFRPAQGNMETYSTGAAAAYSIMRVEEMYFIQAEAAAHLNAQEGKEMLESFMQNYRDPQYTCDATSTDDVVEEIVFQKRVELWGEGQTFFDIKRLNYSVTRGYAGTKHFATARLNTNGRPAWMNFVIVRTEGNNNSAVDAWNNPDPSDLYEAWEQ